MGTRNLTCVYLDGKYRVAQYGQWDGYPEGQGMTCLHFLQRMDEEKFKKELLMIKPMPKGYTEGIMDALGARNGLMTMEQAAKLRELFPEFHRNTAAGILQMIMDGDVGKYLVNEIEFAADSLFCEWCYVIDFDRRTFEVYEGFNHKPLTEEDRFFFLEEKSKKSWRENDDQYHPVKLVKSWSLDALPTDEEFLKAFREEEDEHAKPFGEEE